MKHTYVYSFIKYDFSQTVNILCKLSVPGGIHKIFIRISEQLHFWGLREPMYISVSKATHYLGMYSMYSAHISAYPSGNTRTYVHTHCLQHEQAILHNVM